MPSDYTFSLCLLSEWPLPQTGQKWLRHTGRLQLLHLCRVLMSDLPGAPFTHAEEPGDGRSQMTALRVHDRNGGVSLFCAHSTMRDSTNAYIYLRLFRDLPPFLIIFSLCMTQELI